MTPAARRLARLAALLLLEGVWITPRISGGAAPTKRAPTEAQRYRAAAAELLRADPETARRTGKELRTLPEREPTGTERMAAILTRHLEAKEKKLNVEGIHVRGPRAAAEDGPVRGALGRTLEAIVRRDVVLERMGVTSKRSVEPRPRPGQKSSDLEGFLRWQGIKDWKTVAESFNRDAMVYEIVLPEGATLLRLFGGDSRPTGRYLFCCLEAPESAPPRLLDSAGRFGAWTDASGLALPPANIAEHLALVRLPPGTKATFGVVADNFADVVGERKLGGNAQILLTGVTDFPYDQYRLRGTGESVSDIVAGFDGGEVLRFRH